MFEVVGEVIHQASVEVVAAEVGIAGGGTDLDHAPADDREHRLIGVTVPHPCPGTGRWCRGQRVTLTGWVDSYIKKGCAVILAAARENNCFADRRIADHEARIAEPQLGQGNEVDQHSANAKPQNDPVSADSLQDMSIIVIPAAASDIP